MAGDIECGNCDVCKKQNVVGIERTYFRYEEIKCECHGNCHFEIVYHCPTCVPKEPVETKLVIQTSRLRELVVKKIIKNNQVLLYAKNLLYIFLSSIHFNKLSDNDVKIGNLLSIDKEVRDYLDKNQTLLDNPFLHNIKSDSEND